MILRLVAKRLVYAALTLFVVSALIFFGTVALPGDPASKILGRNATPSSLEQMRDRLNLDRPAVERYAEWVAGIARGDLGRSVTVGNFSTGAEGVPVADLIGPKVKNTLILMAVTSVILFPLGVVLGVVAAARAGSATDSVISNGTLMAMSLPEYVPAILLVMVFAVIWPVLPALSFVNADASLTDWARALVLPVATMLIAALGQVARMTRGAVLDILQSDYVQMARLKGVPERAVLFDHALRNAWPPILQIIALNIGWMVGGVVVIETVFGYPGLGEGIVSAVSARDYPVVQAYALIAAAAYIFASIIADVLTVMATPRLRERAA